MTRSEKTFGDYLKCIHAEDYIGTDDNMPDAFDDWLGNLDIDEIMLYAEAYAQTIRNAYEEAIAKEPL